MEIKKYSYCFGVARNAAPEIPVVMDAYASGHHITIPGEPWMRLTDVAGKLMPRKYAAALACSTAVIIHRYTDCGGEYITATWEKAAGSDLISALTAAGHNAAGLVYHTKTYGGGRRSCSVDTYLDGWWEHNPALSDEERVSAVVDAIADKPEHKLGPDTSRFCGAGVFYAEGVALLYELEEGHLLAWSNGERIEEEDALKLILPRLPNRPKDAPNELVGEDFHWLLESSYPAQCRECPQVRVCPRLREEIKFPENLTWCGW